MPGVGSTARPGLPGILSSRVRIAGGFLGRYHFDGPLGIRGSVSRP